jgi:hypothetical protein
MFNPPKSVGKDLYKKIFNWDDVTRFDIIDKSERFGEDIALLAGNKKSRGIGHITFKTDDGITHRSIKTTHPLKGQATIDSYGFKIGAKSTTNSIIHPSNIKKLTPGYEHVLKSSGICDPEMLNHEQANINIAQSLNPSLGSAEQDVAGNISIKGGNFYKNTLDFHEKNKIEVSEEAKEYAKLMIETHDNLSKDEGLLLKQAYSKFVNIFSPRS